MTLADILEPTAVVLAHAEVKGLQIGAGVGAAICIPLLSLKPSLVNVQDDPPLVAIAKCAGTGALVGTVIVGGGCIAKLASIDKEGIHSRAEALRANVEQMQLDRIACAGAGVGLGLVSLRISKMAEAENSRFVDVACTKSSAWEFFCFSVLGAAVSVGAVTVGKVAIKALDKATYWAIEKAAGKQDKHDMPEDIDSAAKDAADAVNLAVADAAAATDTKAADPGAKAAEIVEEVKSSIQPPSQ